MPAALDTHSIVYGVAGLAALAGALLPRLVRNLPVSTPIVCLGLGLLLFALPLPVDAPDPLRFPEWAEYLTELGVIVSLMGAGLKLDRPLGWRSWGTTWRLLAVTMPLTIAATALLGWWMLGLAPAAALLLGAVLAPTDPVLASDVQVGPPGEAAEEDPEDAEEEVRFALTSEAGLNDALAFPFTNLALVLAVEGLAAGPLLEWAAVDVVYKLAVGFAGGRLVGWLLAKLVFGHGSGDLQLAKAGEGFVALAATLVAYGVTELVGGYGFLAVFVAAVTLRHSESDHEYHETLHEFAEQTERLLMIGIVLLLGGAVAGGILGGVGLGGVGLALLFVFAVRPVTAGLAVSACSVRLRDKAAISFFGIRGVGSLYYLAYALNHGSFAEAELLWAVVALVTVASIVIHGITVTPAIRHLDSSRERQAVG